MFYTLFHSSAETLIAVGRSFVQLLSVFFYLHWLVGLANALITATAGLGIVRLASEFWPLRSAPILVLRLRRLVYLVALFKGALYLTCGDSLYVEPASVITVACRIPPILSFDFRMHGPDYVLFHPNSATAIITIGLCGVALVLLSMRVIRIGLSCRVLDSLDQICGACDSKAEAALNRAAAAINLKRGTELPRILLVEVACSTPLLVGVHRPRLIVSPSLVHILSEHELELAFRHELAHLKRNDHWWRLIQIWIEDVATPILIGRRLGCLSVQIEELICDRMSVKSPDDARALANAIAKATVLLNGIPSRDDRFDDLSAEDAVGTAREKAAMPALLGNATAPKTIALHSRIQALLAIYKEMYCMPEAGHSSVTARQSAVQIILGLLLQSLLSILLFDIFWAEFLLRIKLP